MTEPIPFIDVGAQRDRLGSRVDDAIGRVLAHGRFILGPEVHELEQRLAELGGAADVVSCASGTDALLLALLAFGLEPDSAVIVPSFTFVATAEAVVLAGGVPVFADVGEVDFNLDAASAVAAIEAAREAGLRPVGIIAVDLYGLPAPYGDLAKVAADAGLWVLADAAQSVGGSLDGAPVGSLAPVTATSFFPSKPLGCYGDGGAVFVDDPDLAATMRSLRVHGQGIDKYDNVRIGLNARLDTIQAAVLLVKLEVFAEEIEARATVAARYDELLRDVVGTPVVPEGATSAWAQYTVRVVDRPRLVSRLAERGIPTQVYYRKPLHQQPAYLAYPTAACPVSEALSDSVLSLPMHPYLEASVQEHIAATIRAEVGPG